MITFCSDCACDCTARHFLCDQIDGAWCHDCFLKKPCGQGMHGEGCATQVFGEEPS